MLEKGNGKKRAAGVPFDFRSHGRGPWG
jgi:hypothetical protein